MNAMDEFKGEYKDMLKTYAGYDVKTFSSQN